MAKCEIWKLGTEGVGPGRGNFYNISHDLEQEVHPRRQSRAKQEMQRQCQLSPWERRGKGE